MYNLDLLDDYVQKGLLRKAEDENLVQYNYSEYTNNEGLWDEITMFNRGNIYEKKTGNLIAKAMPKFMNLSQLHEDKQEELLMHKEFNLTEKMDGCLGILYMYKGEIRCNSRGGFDNYVTDKIKELLPKYSMVKKLLEHNTLNVEVISPETKIICNYGDIQDLYLITAYSNNPNIGELSYSQIKLMAQIMRMPVVKEYNMTWDELLSWQKSADWTQEGFVIRFPNNERVKIKSEDYLRIAKFKIGLSKKSLWKLWKNDLEQNTDTLNSYLERDIPDELTNIAKGYLKELKEELQYHCKLAYQEYEATQNIPKNELFKYYETHPNKYQSCNYSLRNNKDITKILIKMIEPEG